ncbi:hypothetical protein SERLA73DRAFT_62996, partial [Serpula lacrymans var. lacrymans S7.3]
CKLSVAVHIGNPCGHSYCAECGYEWISKNKRSPTCAVCRAKLSMHKPLFSNVMGDSIVRRYIELLANNGDISWQHGGSKITEWDLRKVYVVLTLVQWSSSG